MTKLIAFARDPGSGLPKPARVVLGVFIAELHALDERVLKLDSEIVCQEKENPVAWRLVTISGVGHHITATASVALAPSAAASRRGRDFAAWLSLTRLQTGHGSLE